MCRITGATSTPRATSSVTSSAVNGRPAPGISAPLHAGEDGLVGLERPRLGDVPVPDGLPVPAEVVLQRVGELETRDGESITAGETRDELGVGAARQLEADAQRRSRVGAPVTGPQLDEPGAVGGRRREPELQWLLAESGLERGCERRRGVDHEEVARGQDVEGRENGRGRARGHDASRRAAPRRRGPPRAPPVARAPPAERIARARSRCTRELACPVAAARKRALDQRQQAGHARLWQGQVRDVLTRERLLVGLGAHVARVDAVHAQLRLLGRGIAVSCSRAAFEEPYPPQPSYGSTAASEVRSRMTAPGVSRGRASWMSASGRRR